MIVARPGLRRQLLDVPWQAVLQLRRVEPDRHA